MCYILHMIETPSYSADLIEYWCFGEIFQTTGIIVTANRYPIMRSLEPMSNAYPNPVLSTNTTSNIDLLRSCSNDNSSKHRLCEFTSIVSSNADKEPSDFWDAVRLGITLEPEERYHALERARMGKALPAAECGRWDQRIATRIGFASASGYRAARTVFTKGIPELKMLVEENVLKITPASRIAAKGEHRQRTAVRVIRVLHNGGYSKRIIGYAVQQLVTGSDSGCETLDRLSDEATIKELVEALRSDHATHRNGSRVTRRAVHTETSLEPERTLDEIQQLLKDFLFNTTADTPSQDKAENIAQQLLTIERLAENIRETIRAKTDKTGASSDGALRDRCRQLRETVQFFTHALRRTSRPIGTALSDELQCTFRNTTTILSTVADHIARHTSLSAARPARIPASKRLRVRCGNRSGASLAVTPRTSLSAVSGTCTV